MGKDNKVTLVFVHGGAVSDMDTYRELPEALVIAGKKHAPVLKIDIKQIYLGRYISFHDEVIMDDIARAFNQARLDVIGDKPFSCITHSTGAPVIRIWIDLFYGARKLDSLPLRHLIMLAPANHGTALAQLTKGALGRISTWVTGLETGQKVMDWLELNSVGQWDLNKSYLSYKPAQNNKFFPFVLAGQQIDHKLYDHINSYTGEKGSDGAIRVSGANLNYKFVRLRQSSKEIEGQKNTYALEVVGGSLKSSPSTPLAIISETSHTGKKYGIMYSVTKNNAEKKDVVKRILDCLHVKNKEQYSSAHDKFKKLSEKTQNEDKETKDRYSMIFFQLHDDRGNAINDYDILLLGSKNYDPNELQPGFFVDRQKNKVNGNQLTYYVDCMKMLNIKDGCFGFRIIARPSEGFSYYRKVEFRSDEISLGRLLIPNQILYVDIEIKRYVDENVFRLFRREDFSSKKVPMRFKKIGHAGVDIP